jgi:inward rectifier potassium channel
METQRLSPLQDSANNNQADMRDLGFGSVVARESRQRLLNRDGSFNVLKLVRDRVVFFPLSWTIAHPIDETSPFYGMSPEDLRKTRGEFLVLLTGFDETFSQTVHARSSYLAEEVVWNARFADIFNRPADDGLLTIDVRKLHSIEPINAEKG